MGGLCLAGEELVREVCREGRRWLESVKVVAVCATVDQTGAGEWRLA